MEGRLHGRQWLARPRSRWLLLVVCVLAIALAVMAVKRSVKKNRFLVQEQAWTGPGPDRFMQRVLKEVPRVAQVKPGDADAKEVLKGYLRIMIPDKAAYATQASRTHGNEELGWGLAYDLQAAMVAYQQTGDPEFLDLFEHGFDAALEVRDDKLGRRDDLRQRMMAGWGTKAYSEGKDANAWITWDALTGMLLYPAALYAGAVAQDPQLAARKPRAATYLQAAREGVAAFDDWWREDTARKEGFYFDPLYQDPAPLNHMNLLGLAHTALCSGFGDAASCHKARHLARFFAARYRYKPDGACAWEYWEGPLQKKNHTGVLEDISHAFLNMEFAEHVHRAGIALEKKEVKCIADVFHDHVIRSNDDWGAYIDGSGRLVAEHKQYGMPAFVVLERFRPGIARKVDLFVRANPKAFPLGWMSYCSGPKGFAYQLPAGGRPGTWPSFTAAR